MPSTFSSNLRLELPATGEYYSTWGPVANRVFTDIDNAIAGRVTVVMPSDGTYTLTANNGAPDEARYMGLNITSSTTLTATRDVVVPSVSKLYVINNATTGGQSINVRTSAGGTQAVIANGALSLVWCNGNSCTTQLLGGYVGSNVANTFTALQTISIGSATLSGDYQRWSPTDFGTGKPYLAVQKGSAADVWHIRLFDGVNSNGTINFNSSALTFNNVPIALTSGSSFVDNTTYFVDNADQTKRLQLELAGISTATTRTLTVPNASGTIALTSDLASAVPSGTIVPFAGVTVPAGWLFCNGQPVSRTTYASLFNAITSSFSAVSTSGSAVLSATTPSQLDYHFELAGSPIEGTNITVSTWVSGATSTTITMSELATGSGSINARIFPYGNGDGANTFNVPDLRGLFIRGWDPQQTIDVARAYGVRQDDDAKVMYATASNTATTGGGANRVTNLGTGVNQTGNETRPKNRAMMYIIKA